MFLLSDVTLENICDLVSEGIIAEDSDHGLLLCSKFNRNIDGQECYEIRGDETEHLPDIWAASISEAVDQANAWLRERE